MKKILIDKICLRYFKGVENKEIVLGDNINVVKGRNGIGKSTIADAISWVLFGTNQARCHQVRHQDQGRARQGD